MTNWCFRKPRAGPLASSPRSGRTRLFSLVSVVLPLLLVVALVAGTALAHVKPGYEWCNDPATGKPKRTLQVYVDPDAGDEWRQWTQQAMDNWNNANTGWTLEMTNQTEGAEVTVHAAPIPAYPDGSVSAGECRSDFDGATGEVVGATITANSDLDWGTTGDDVLDPVKMLKHELGHTMRLTHSELGNLMEESIGDGDHNRAPNNDDIDEAKEAAATTRVPPESATGADGKVRMTVGDVQLEADPLAVSQVAVVTGHPLTVLPMEGVMLPQPLAVPAGLGRVVCAAGVFPTQAEFPLPVALSLNWGEGAVSGLDLAGELHYHLLPPVDVSALIPVVWRADSDHTGSGTWAHAEAEVLIDQAAQTARMYLRGGGVYGLAGPYATRTQATASLPFTDLTVGHYPVVAEALTELRAMDIYRGYPDGTAQPGKNLTRLEFFTLAVRLAGGEQTVADAGRTRPNFVDEIPDWGWGYVNQAVAMGLAKGYPDGTFMPYRDVTGAEALAVLVRVLGPEGEAIAARQPWPQGYVQTATALGLLEELVGLVGDLGAWSGAMINRGQMAVLTRAAAWTSLRYAAAGGLTEGGSIAAARGWWRTSSRLRALSADGRRCVLAEPVELLGLGLRERFDFDELVYVPPAVGTLPRAGDTASLLGRGVRVRAVMGP